LLLQPRHLLGVVRSGDAAERWQKFFF